MREEMLLTGSLEPANVCAGQDRRDQARRSLSPAVWGRFHFSHADQSLWAGDNYHPEHSYVLAALIRRLHKAKLAVAPAVTIWDILAVDDLAESSFSIPRALRCAAKAFGCVQAGAP